jgi:biofilm PGA synthesis protein PgaA
VIALRNRERWVDALDGLARMRRDEMPIRPYIREAEADSLLALRKPEEARAIYAELAAVDPANRNARIGRFYAEVECEDFEAAFRTADSLDDVVLSALARSYAGMDAQAWQLVEPIVRRAPVPRSRVRRRPRSKWRAAGPAWRMKTCASPPRLRQTISAYR